MLKVSDADIDPHANFTARVLELHEREIIDCLLPAVKKEPELGRVGNTMRLTVTADGVLQAEVADTGPCLADASKTWTLPPIYGSGVELVAQWRLVVE